MHTAALGDLLFYCRDQVGLDDVLRQGIGPLRGYVDALPDGIFSEKSDDEIAAHLAKEHAIQPLSRRLRHCQAQRSRNSIRSARSVGRCPCSRRRPRGGLLFTVVEFAQCEILLRPPPFCIAHAF
jgi:hypothetical protein